MALAHQSFREHPQSGANAELEDAQRVCGLRLPEPKAIQLFTSLLKAGTEWPSSP